MSKLINCFLVLLLLLFVSCQKETKRKLGYGVEGIDVSHHQSEIRWDSLTKQNLRFVFMKATEGSTHTDTKFDYNWSEAKRVGLKRGAYHFFSMYSNATEQARHFIEKVKLEQGDLPPVLDFEHDQFFPNPSITDSLDVWLSIVGQYFKVKPIIYTNYKLYNTYIKNHLENYPLWIARYNNEALPFEDAQNPYIWQYGNRGRMAGIQGDVDFNVYTGTLSDLENICYNPLEKKPKLLTNPE